MNLSEIFNIKFTDNNAPNYSVIIQAKLIVSVIKEKSYKINTPEFGHIIRIFMHTLIIELDESTYKYSLARNIKILYDRITANG